MSNLICGICHKDIYIYYYKSKECDCNVRYHLDCIIKWHKINKKCIYCKKKVNIDLEKIKNKYIENIFTLISIIISIIFIILYYII